MGCLRLLDGEMDSMPAEDVRDIIDTAVASGNPMVNLLNDIGNTSSSCCDQSSTENTGTMVKEEVEYSRAATELSDVAKSLAIGKEVKLSTLVDVHPSKSNPRNYNVNQLVSIHRIKVTQVLTNIVNNAIKYTHDQGHVQIHFGLAEDLSQAVEPFLADAENSEGCILTRQPEEILGSTAEVQNWVSSSASHRQQETPQQWLTMMIRDNGCGVKPWDLPDIFSPYTQASGSTERSKKASSRDFQGTGLGLYICQNLCYQMKGFLACTSTTGRGTTFYVGLPASGHDDDRSNVSDRNFVPESASESETSVGASDDSTNRDDDHDDGVSPNNALLESISDMCWFTPVAKSDTSGSLDATSVSSTESS